MPFAVTTIPGFAVVAVIAWEVHCHRIGEPGKHCRLFWCIAATIWAVYYAVVGVYDFRTQRHAIAIVAFGLAVMAGSLAAKALGIKLGSHLIAEAAPDVAGAHA